MRNFGDFHNIFLSVKILRHRVSNGERDERAQNLKDQKILAQLLLVNRAGEKNEEVDEREVAAGHHTVLALLPLHQLQSFEDEERKFADLAQFFLPEGRFAVIHQPRLGIELRQTMPRARNEVEQLRHRVEEVEHLRDEEQQNRFAEMSENSDDGERHA